MPPRDKRFSNGQLQDTSKHDSCDAFFNWYFLNVVPWMYCSTLFWFALRYIPTCFCLGPGVQTKSQSLPKDSNCRQSIWQRLQPWVRSTQTWLLYIYLASLSQDYVAEEISQWTWFMFNSLSIFRSWLTLLPTFCLQLSWGPNFDKRNIQRLAGQPAWSPARAAWLHLWFGQYRGGICFGRYFERWEEG